MYTGAVVGLLAKIVDSVTNLQMTNWWRFSEDFATLLGHIDVIFLPKTLYQKRFIHSITSCMQKLLVICSVTTAS